MTRGLYSAELLEVRNAISNLELCQESTIANLRQILRQGKLPTIEDGVHIKEAGRIITRSSEQNVIPPKPQQRSRRRPDASGVALSSTAIIKIATEIANAALKTLTSAVRDQSRKAETQSNVGSELSRNEGSRKLPPKKHQIRVIAQCAVEAFSCMFSSESLKDASNSHQLEFGVSSLISKLIALGLFDLAQQELEKLMKHLHQISCKEACEDRDSPHPTSIVELLDVKHHPSSGALLSVLIASQLHVLRLVSQSGLGHSEKVLYYMQHGSSSSSFDIIKEAYSSGLMNAEVAAKNLTNLSHTLFEFRAVLEIPVDGFSTESYYREAVHVLELHLLAQEARQEARCLCGDGISFSMELMGPLMKSVKSLIRRGVRLTSSDQRMLIVQIRKHKLLEVDESSICSLAPLQQKQLNEFQSMLLALGLPFRTLNRSSNEVSPISNSTDGIDQELTRNIQALSDKAAVIIRSEHVVVEDLMMTLQELCQMLQSDSDDLMLNADEAIISLSTLRRLLYQLLRHRTSKSRPDELYRTDASFKAGTLVILGIPVFVHRYLSHADGKKEQRDSQGVCKHRQNMCNQIIGPTLDAVIALSGAIAADTDSSFQIFHKAVDACTNIVDILEKVNNADQADKRNENLAGMHVRFSDCLASVYLKRAKLKVRAIQDIELLETAVEILYHRSEAEREKANHIGKLEKLVRELVSLSQHEQALRHLESAIIVISIGTPDFETGDLNKTVRLPKDLDMLLTRLLRKHLKIGLKSSSTSSLFALRRLNQNVKGAARNFTIDLQLLELLEMVKSEQLAAAKSMEICDEFIRSTYYLSQPAECRIRWIGIILHLINVCGFEGASDTVRPFKKAFITASKDVDSDSIALSDSSCLLSLALLSDNADEDMISSNLDRWTKFYQVEKGGFNVHPAFQSYYLDQLSLLINWFELHGHFDLKCRGIEVLNTLYSSSPTSFQDPELGLRICYDLANQYLKTGRVAQAGELLHIRDDVSYRELANSDAMVSKLYAVKAVYFTRIGLNEVSEELLNKSLTVLNELRIQNQQSWKSRAEYLDTCITFLEAMYDLRTVDSNLVEALFYAKSCARIACSIIAVPKPSETEEEQAAGSEVKDFDKRPVDNTRSSDHLLDAFRIRQSMPLMTGPRSIAALVKLYKCFADFGHALDAKHCLEQAKEIANKIKSKYWCRRIHQLEMHFDLITTHGSKYFGNSNANEENLLVEGVMDMQMALRFCVDHVDRGELDVAKLFLKQYFKRLEILNHKSTSHMASESDLIDRMQGLEIEDQRAAPFQTNEGRTQRRHTRTTRKLKTSTPGHHIGDDSVDNLSQLRGQGLVCGAAIANAQENNTKACNLLSEASKCALRDIVKGESSFLSARISLQSSIEGLVGSPVYSLLCESPLAFPGQTRADSRILQVDPGKLEYNRSKSRLVKVTTSSRRAVQQSLEDDIVNSLTKAKNDFSAALELTYLNGQTRGIHHLSKELTRAMLLLSTIGASPSVDRNMYSVLSALEIGRNIAWERTIRVIEIERSMTRDHLLMLNLPESIPAKEKHLNDYMSEFRKSYVEILPPDWVVIGLSLSHDKRDLNLYKVSRAKEPLVLSIPLRRQLSEADDEGFTYEDCRSELNEILTLANASTHNTADGAQRQAKNEWWKTRTALDQRMKDLLTSIDELWLGGFRGLFSDSFPVNEAFSDFCVRFDTILAKHLPSRQVLSKHQGKTHVSINSQILEIFIGLGPSNDDGNLDDPLLDLLTFTVDIIQFAGEQNAYDEIDFDAMIVDVLDALTQYHFAVRNLPSDSGHLHTILILDKHLHSFPWESLPSLKGMPMSRLPSFEALRNIVVRQNNLKSRVDQPQFSVSRSKGSYVLNPAGDLISTENTFRGVLSQLPLSWDGIIRKPPTEAELQDILVKKDIYLYLGHGSGAQYIRGKTIRKLQNCAVALLLGCSSATVTEAGHLESHGIPFTYLQAGSPAVLGTLWDVTDKDIDKFSMKLLRTWGLFEKETSTSDKSRSVSARKGKSRRHDNKTHQTHKKDHQNSRISLDMAVAEAREECIMRYLNGAAPVLYGVPIFVNQV